MRYSMYLLSIGARSSVIGFASSDEKVINHGNHEISWIARVWKKTAIYNHVWF
jgi:hypothetical protein